MPLPLKLTVIRSAETYCVVRSVEHSEYEIALGARLGAAPRFQLFDADDPVPRNFALVSVGGGKHLAVWCDPTKPELAWYREIKDAPKIVEDKPAVINEVSTMDSTPNVEGLALSASRGLIRRVFQETPEIVCVED